MASVPRRRFAAVLLGAALASLAAAVLYAPAPAAGRLETVRVAVFPTPSNWGLYIGQSEGFFKNAGLDVQLIVIPNAPNTMQALLTGAIEIANVEPFPVFTTVMKHGPIAAIVAGDVNLAPYAVVTTKEITSASQLKGKIIGGTVVTAYRLRAYLKRAGGLGYHDYNFLAAGASGQRLQALEAGRVQAVLLDQPAEFVAHEKGFHTLGYVSDVVPAVGVVLFSGTRWAEANAGALVAFLREFHRSIRWLYDPANKPAAVDLLVREINTSPALAAKTYDLLVTRLRVFSADGTIPDQNVQTLIDAMSAQGDLAVPPPEASQFMDFRYNREANQK
jgi:ABC-type nitrate/sulfonate/bicarbonate transport system substrate-binding protein